MRTKIKRFWQWITGIFAIGAVVTVSMLGAGEDLTKEEEIEASIIKNIETAQESYKDKEKTYFALSKTLDSVPIQSASTTIKSDAKVNGKDSLISVNLALPEKMDMQTEIQNFITDKGETGYMIIFRQIKDGREYYKTVGYGVDAKAHTQDWVEFIKDPS